GAPAHVHPSQHAIDFLPINGGAQVAMYFANDGGIYRALDGYTDLTGGDCGTRNSFENLNQALGSMSQFVSLAQDSNSADMAFGGVQGNGFPATNKVRSAATWPFNISSGDGGFVQMDPRPDHATDWFTQSDGANIQLCTVGSACSSENFSSGQVVSSQ